MAGLPGHYNTVRIRLETYGRTACAGSGDPRTTGDARTTEAAGQAATLASELMGECKLISAALVIIAIVRGSTSALAEPVALGEILGLTLRFVCSTNFAIGRCRKFELIQRQAETCIEREVVYSSAVVLKSISRAENNLCYRG
jgi:hypothetical protein